MSQVPARIGRYEVEGLLGEGGMGVLYLARDPVLERAVALKLLRVDEPDLRRRFVREAQSAARIQHPNIVTVYDVGDHDGQLYIAMEYIDGDTLATLIREDVPFSAIRKLDIIDEIAEGLGFAHQRGIIHRDIKPANLMITRNGLVKVLDFGIARISHKQSGEIDGPTLVGTPAYMAPEQLEGAEADARSDIYAVGLVMYELYSGRRAFVGGTTADVLQRVLEARPTPIAELVPGLDPALAAIINKAMARVPEERYPDLQAMRKDLARARRSAIPASADDATVVVAMPLHGLGITTRPAVTAPPATPAPTRDLPPTFGTSAAAAPPVTVTPPVTAPTHTTPPAWMPAATTAPAPVAEHRATSAGVTTPPPPPMPDTDATVLAPVPRTHPVQAPAAPPPTARTTPPAPPPATAPLPAATGASWLPPTPVPSTAPAAPEEEPEDDRTVLVRVSDVRDPWAAPPPTSAPAAVPPAVSLPPPLPGMASRPEGPATGMPQPPPRPATPPAPSPPRTVMPSTTGPVGQTGGALPSAARSATTSTTQSTAPAAGTPPAATAPPAERRSSPPRAAAAPPPAPLSPPTLQMPASSAPPPAAGPATPVSHVPRAATPATATRKGLPVVVILSGMVVLVVLGLIALFLALRLLGLSGGGSPLSGLFGPRTVTPRVADATDTAPPTVTPPPEPQTPPAPAATTSIADVAPAATEVAVAPQETPAAPAPTTTVPAAPVATAPPVPTANVARQTAPVRPQPASPARPTPGRADPNMSRPDATPTPTTPAAVVRDTPSRPVAPVEEPAPRREVREPEPRVVAPREDAVALVRGYIAARNTSHAAGIRRVWPTVDETHLRRVTSSFSAPLTLTGCNVEAVDADHATATCQMTQPGTTGAFAGNQGINIRRTFTFDLALQGRGWVIVGIRE